MRSSRQSCLSAISASASIGFSANSKAPAFIASTAAVMGDVTLGAESSVWYGAVLRGDMAPIVIGSGLYIWLRERALHRATMLKTVED